MQAQQHKPEGGGRLSHGASDVLKPKQGSGYIRSEVDDKRYDAPAQGVGSMAPVADGERSGGDIQPDPKYDPCVEDYAETYLNRQDVSLKGYCGIN